MIKSFLSLTATVMTIVWSICSVAHESPRISRRFGHLSTPDYERVQEDSQTERVLYYMERRLGRELSDEEIETFLPGLFRRNGDALVIDSGFRGPPRVHYLEALNEMQKELRPQTQPPIYVVNGRAVPRGSVCEQLLQNVENQIRRKLTEDELAELVEKYLAQTGEQLSR